MHERPSVCQPRCPWNTWWESRTWSCSHFPVPMRKEKHQEAKSRSIIRDQDLSQSSPPLWACVYAHIHTCRCVCPHACRRQRRMSNVLFHHSPSYSFEIVSHWTRSWAISSACWWSASHRDSLVSTLCNSKVTSIQTQSLMPAQQALLRCSPALNQNLFCPPSTYLSPLPYMCSISMCCRVIGSSTEREEEWEDSFQRKNHFYGPLHQRTQWREASLLLAPQK